MKQHSVAELVESCVTENVLVPHLSHDDRDGEIGLVKTTLCLRVPSSAKITCGCAREIMGCDLLLVAEE